MLEEGAAQLDSGELKRLRDFLRRAGQLRPDDDPKAAAAAREVADMLRSGFRPIVYCRYIATAEYLAAELQRRLKKEWPDLAVVAVTGKSAEDEREQRVVAQRGAAEHHGPHLLDTRVCAGEQRDALADEADQRGGEVGGWRTLALGQPRELRDLPNLIRSQRHGHT